MPYYGIQEERLMQMHSCLTSEKENGARNQTYKQQRSIIFKNGQPVGAEDFFSGFLSAGGKSRFGRPAGLAISPKSVLYISDDANGVIYSVTPDKSVGFNNHKN